MDITVSSLSAQGHMLALVAYWLIFWQRFLRNPFMMCTSELASTFFPFWIWSKGRIVFKDDIYYQHPACIPFLSSFYPPNVMTSWCSQFLGLNDAFRLFALQVLFHSLLTSVFGFMVFGAQGTVSALFAGVCFAYSGYFVKPFTPCAVYTHCWAVGALLGGPFGAFALGMAILGGYWPTLVYIAPILIWLHPEISWGILLGLPQIIPFLWYWPRSVRHRAKLDKETGKVPLWRYLDMIFPDRHQNSINGIFWPEMAMFCGICPVLALHGSVWLIPLLASFLIQIQRIPARSLYLMSFCLVMMSLESSISLPLLVLQATILLINSSIYPHFPFAQWWKKPSEMAYHDITQWPGITGYLSGKKTAGYKGGFALKEAA